MMVLVEVALKDASTGETMGHASVQTDLNDRMMADRGPLIDAAQDWFLQTLSGAGTMAYRDAFKERRKRRAL